LFHAASSRDDLHNVPYEMQTNTAKVLNAGKTTLAFAGGMQLANKNSPNGPQQR